MNSTINRIERNTHPDPGRRDFLHLAGASAIALGWPALAHASVGATASPGPAKALAAASAPVGKASLTAKPNVAGKASLTAKPYPLGGVAPPVFDLWMVRMDTGEEYKEAYAEQGRLVVPGYNRLCHALRDLREKPASQVVRMDVKLLNLLFATQQWMKVHKQQRPLVITSAYRSRRTNGQIEGAAKNSMHQDGKAVDFYIDGLPVKRLADLVKFFREGGVGMYPDRHFVHVDTGELRFWRG